MLVAIICSSASTFKAILKAYIPKLWSSSQPSNPPNVNQGYDRSNDGRFSMKPYGASPLHKSDSNRKYGVTNLTNLTNLTVIEDESEEVMVTNSAPKVPAFQAKERNNP